MATLPPEPRPAIESTWSQEYQRTQQVRVPNKYGPLRTIGTPLVTLISLIGLGVLAFVYARGLHELSTSERATHSYYRNRSTYDEWITRAKLPKGAVEDNPARMSTLEVLVDLAIDTDERVIEDPRRNAYIVPPEGVHYVYSPPVQIDSGDGAADGDPL